MKKLLLMSLPIVMLCACSQKHVYTVSDGKNSTATPSGTVPQENLRKKLTMLTGETGVVNMMPDATVFRMSGDYQDNVAVTLGPDGSLIYFPAPTDITADSAPVELCDGWWLNCQGFGPNTVFTTYTFAEYASLPQAPDPNQIKQAIIPGAKVTQFMEVPIKLDRAMADPSAVKDYLKNQ